MRHVSIIAAIDLHGGLGKDNHLLCHLPADLKHFKTITLGKPIVMGRRTFESIGKALPDRHNIVVSRTLMPRSDISVVGSLNEALELTKDETEIMIIGGARLFEEALNIAQRLYLTQIHHQFDADVFFPDINKSIWIEKESFLQVKDEKNAYDMKFYIYEKKIKKVFDKGARNDENSALP